MGVQKVAACVSSSKVEEYDFIKIRTGRMKNVTFSNLKLLILFQNISLFILKGVRERD